MLLLLLDRVFFSIQDLNVLIKENIMSHPKPKPMPSPEPKPVPDPMPPQV
jgi:hypothetical protein